SLFSMAAQDGVIPIRVLVRVRPLSKKEKGENAQECVRSYVEQNQISCNDRMFAFDAVFDPSSSQEEVYMASAGVLIDKMFAGYNCTILAYGQTGSGKTHTMGTEETKLTMLSESRGIVPRIVNRIFQCIMESEKAEAFTVKVSMLEVYDDKVIDLLARNPSKEGLQIREKEGAPFVQGLTTHNVTDLESTMGMLEKGGGMRSKGETAMNAASSRSHAVFTILVQKNAIPNDESVWESKLRLVDLAGSERLKKTMAEGERKKEGIRINEGLHALGKVIQALSSEEKHIPYRDSKITRLLQDSLGGSSYTVMIACVSPADSNGEETLSTLRYADRVKSIKNKPTVQLDPTQALIQKLRDENAALLLEVAAYREGRVPDVIVPISAAPPSMNAPRAIAATAAATPMCIGTPRRMVRREEMDEMSENAKKLERTVAALKDKIAELLMCKAKQSEALVKAEMEMERMNERGTELEEALKNALLAETPTEVFEKLKETMKGVEEEKVKREKEEKEKEEESHRESALNGDDSKMDEDMSTMGEDEEAAHEEEMNGILRNTESLEREMDIMMKEIAVKEKLALSNVAEYTRLQAMEGEHRKELESLTARMEVLQKERDKLQEDLKKAGNTSKVSEERRKRLAEIEKELFTQRRKVNELKNIEKLKKQSDETAQKLRKEIAEMKALRVRMTKQIRAEADKYREFKMIADKKMAQLQSKDRKRDTETARLTQKLNQQLVVVKRKFDDATAANKRLQQQLMKSKNASIDRKMDDKTDEMWKEHVRNELELVASTYSAERSVDEMSAQRTTLSRTMNGLKNRLAKLANEPPTKRRSTAEGEKEDESERKRLEAEQAECQEEIDKISATIHQLQLNTSSINLPSHAETRWNTVHTAAAAKLALKHLFEEAAGYIRSEVDTKKKTEMEKDQHNKKILKLTCDVNERNGTIKAMKKQQDAFLKNLNIEKIEFDNRRRSLLSMFLESEKVEITEEHMEQLKEMQDSINKMDMTKPSTRSCTRSTRSSTPDELMQGPRETRGPKRFGNIVNTMDAVKVEDGEMDTTMNDEKDTTFRMDNKERGVTKRKTRSKGELAEDDQPKRMTRQTSSRRVVPEESRPSPIRDDSLRASRRESKFFGIAREGGTNAMEVDEDDEMGGMSNETFIVPHDEDEKKERKKGGEDTKENGSGARRGRTSKNQADDDVSSNLQSMLEGGVKKATSGGLGDIM
ncbi:hypothetical protein PFISCL1PPCAC_10740, partial [Pristionchus fissidentatus]